MYIKSSQRSPRFSPVFSSRSFIALHSTFMSVIHFELVSVKVVIYLLLNLFLYVNV